MLKEHGLKVSNLYISQLKNAIKNDCVRKCGIEVGENYNLRKTTRRMDCLQADSTTAANLEKLVSQGMPKSRGARGPVDLCSARTGVATETARQPQATPEKEEAIMKAFRHFGII